MTTPSSGGSGFQHSETNRGGADAVPDSPHTSGHGAEPGADTDVPTTAPVESRGGFGLAGWLVLAVLILVALVYGLAFVAR